MAALRLFYPIQWLSMCQENAKGFRTLEARERRILEMLLNAKIPRRAMRLIGWFLVLIWLYLLFVFLNAAFLLPFPYFGERGLIIIGAAALLLIVGWLCLRLLRPAD